MQDLIEGAIRAIGWLVLKAITVWRYKSDGHSAMLAEGAVGLLSVAALLWVAYTWWRP